MPLLVDTGVLYALADRRDDWHAPVRRLVERSREPLLAPVTILAEVTYLLVSRLGPAAELAFVWSIAQGEIGVEPLSVSDCRRAHDLLGTYPAIGFVDATVVAQAERLKLGTIATTDRRHFGMIRPRHLSRFTLVP